jgi:hypothetical protein
LQLDSSSLFIIFIISLVVVVIVAGKGFWKNGEMRIDVWWIREIVLFRLKREKETEMRGFFRD